MKSNYSEADIKRKFITPAIVNAGWDSDTQIREEFYFTDGRIQVRGQIVNRGKGKRVDYLLYYKPNIPIAVIEAKDANHTLSEGMQQALGYAEVLDLPFVFTSNGSGFRFHDRSGTFPQIETDLKLDEFPSPQILWEKYCQWKGLEQPDLETIYTQDYYSDGSGKAPRYYQCIAINRTVEAIAKGEKRILIVMATGTGKTYTAFQIIWRLWKAKVKRRILFLTDRNILADQTKNNDFKPFGQAMTKITKRQINKSYEVYLALYQAVTGSEEQKDIFKQFSRDFFDLVVIDECHRGSASENSAWRKVLEYFSNATHIGLTATPKETADVSNRYYFGDPIYTYSLRQGIEDGFLAPYKVIRIDIDKDLMGFRPQKGQRDKYGEEIEDRIYNQRDFDRNLVIDERTLLVARKITEYLSKTSQYDKTIVFCEDTEHAERMRQALVNLNPELVRENHRYVMRITGDDKEGKEQLDTFIDPLERYPVIATTSKLLETGVDAKTCKLIVLDKVIRSMTDFKQIIGRGTRIDEKNGKRFFTIMDFKKATELFADPNFDGIPDQIYEPNDDDPIIPPDDEREEQTTENDPDDRIIDGDEWTSNPFDPTETPTPIGNRRQKYYVHNVQVEIIGERVQYLDKDGKLVMESYKDFTSKTVKEKYRTLKDFLNRWSSEKKKQAIVKELEEQEIYLEHLQQQIPNGEQYGAFDLICHLVFDQPPLTRKERAENVKKRDVFTKYGDKARAVLNALLDKYVTDDIVNIEDRKVLQLKPISEMGTTVEIINDFFGGKKSFEAALEELESALFDDELTA